MMRPGDQYILAPGVDGQRFFDRFIRRFECGFGALSPDEAHVTLVDFGTAPCPRGYWLTGAYDMATVASHLGRN